jgi:SAM-dependent methyltransferase
MEYPAVLSSVRTLRRRLGHLRHSLRSRLSPPPPPDPTIARRTALAAEYLRGTGIEIGALHKPLLVPKTVRVHYVDRMTPSQLVQHYPEHAQGNLVDVRIVDDGELLTTIPDASQDFVIANHFIEHCQDTIGALTNHFRVLKPGGILYLAIPDKRYTFDIDRRVTPLDHVHRDHDAGPAWSRAQHFEEWVRSSELSYWRGHQARESGRDAAWSQALADPRSEDELRERIQKLMETDYSIHYHVWTQLDFLELLLSLRDRLSFDIETMVKQGEEFVMILRKTAPRDTAQATM